MILILISVAVALLFYLIFPIIGCVVSVKRWNKILETIVSSRFFPIFTKKTNFEEMSSSLSPVRVRYFGRIEHIPENSSDEEFFYFYDGKKNFKLRKKDTICYEIKEKNKTNYSSHNLENICWADFIACTKGADLFITGMLEECNGTEKNTFSFSKTDDKKIVLVFYEGTQKDFWTKVLHSSPQKSPWKNSFSLISLLIGFFTILSLILPLFSTKFPIEYGFWGYTLLFSPVFTLLPPGLILFCAFIFYFKKAENYTHYSDLIHNQVYGLSVSNRVLTLSDQSEYELRSVEKTTIPPVTIPKNIKRGLLLHEKEDWFVCGVKPKDEYAELDIPIDPFFDRFSMPASPLHLINVCQKKSIVCKVLSGCFLAVDIFCNFFLFYNFFLLLSLE